MKGSRPPKLGKDAKATAKMVEANQVNQVNQANPPSGQKPRANLSRSFDWEKGMASLQHYHQEGEQVRRSKNRKTHPKRFHIYWRFMLYFRFWMSAKSVNIYVYVNV